MSAALAISKRELFAYFSTPLAYVFIVIFLARSSGVFLFSSVALSVPDTGCRYAVVGRGA